MAREQHTPGQPLRYRTTRPIIPPLPNRETIESRVSDNLIIQLRRSEPTDIEHIHRLRTQDEVMKNTSQGRSDVDIGASQKWMDRFLPPKDVIAFNFMLWAKQDDQPWEHIGNMGCHLFERVPQVGYMLRTEWWGRRIATTALQMLLSAWLALERREVEINFQGVDSEHDLHMMRLELDQEEQVLSPLTEIKVVPEILLAEIEQFNIGSKKVVERCGFKYQAREQIVHELGLFVLLDYTISKAGTN